MSALEKTIEKQYQNSRRMVGLLTRTLDEISALVEKDPDGKKFPQLWSLHADICQALDEIEE